MATSAAEETAAGALYSQKAISYNGKAYNTIREGLAEILNPQPSSNTSGENSVNKPKSASKEQNARQTVFYNPIQQYNRDLSVLAIRAYAEDLAAVRLATQRKRIQTTGRAETRGKKRKRGTDHEATKKDKREEEAESAVVTELLNGGVCYHADIAGVEPQERRDGMFDAAAGAEGDSTMEEPKQKVEDRSKLRDGENHGKTASMKHSESTDIDAHPPGAGADSFDPPKKVKNKAPPLSQSFRILDALSATGLRALRYAKEISSVTHITANDLVPQATASIRLNIAHNALDSKITTTTSNALEHMYSTTPHSNDPMHQLYHVIDLDPYGTAAPFLDAAVQAVVDGGLLCVTCTDAGVFASIGYLEKTFSQYGGLPLKGPHAHEAGLRLILHAIATTAARYGIVIEPLLSLSIDFYARVFVRVQKSPAEVKFLASKTMVVYQCDAGCGSWSKQFLAQAKGKEARNGETFYKFTSALGPSAGKECEYCGFRTHLAGPMWGGALHNPFFVKRILDMLPELDREVYQTVPRIEGMLSMALEEDLEDPWASIADSRQQAFSKGSYKQLKQKSTTMTTTASLDPDAESRAPTSAQLSDRPIPPLPAHHRITAPFFIHPPTLARTLNTPTPSSAQLRGALIHLGYKTSRSHTEAGSIITDAPFDIIWEIMREWARTKSKGGKGPKIKENTAGAGIMKKDRANVVLNRARKDITQKINAASSTEDLKKELEASLYRLNAGYSTNPTYSTNTASPTPSQPHPGSSTPPLPLEAAPISPKSPTNLPKPPPDPELHKLDIVFDEQLGKDPALAPGQRKLVRYQENPRENWGPLAKARTS